MKIEAGTSVKYTIIGFDSTFFDPTNEEENLEIKIYNQENDLLMKTVTEIIV